MSLIVPQVSNANIVEDLVSVWNDHYDNSGIRENHPNRKNFKKYADQVKNVMERLEAEYKEDGKSKKLPILYPEYDRYLHIIIGATIIKETSVRAKVIGKKRQEVGLMQVHGKALMGHSRKEVLRNPELGIYLGTRWLLHCILLSGKKITTLEDYGPAFSYYTCGHKCKGKMINSARQRLNLAYEIQGGAVKPIERIIEAVSYQLSGGDDWWEQFDSKKEAEKTLIKAKNSDEDEFKEYLVELMADGIVLDQGYDTMFINIIRDLKKQLKDG